MTPIYNSEDKRPLELSYKQKFALNTYQTMDEVHSRMRYDAARRIADKVMEQEKFFRIETNDPGYASMRTSIIMMTPDEYSEFHQENFKRGLNHAKGYMMYPSF